MMRPAFWTIFIPVALWMSLIASAMPASARAVCGATGQEGWCYRCYPEGAGQKCNCIPPCQNDCPCQQSSPSQSGSSSKTGGTTPPRPVIKGTTNPPITGTKQK